MRINCKRFQCLASRHPMERILNSHPFPQIFKGQKHGRWGRLYPYNDGSHGGSSIQYQPLRHKNVLAVWYSTMKKFCIFSSDSRLLTKRKGTDNDTLTKNRYVYFILFYFTFLANFLTIYEPIFGQDVLFPREIITTTSGIYLTHTPLKRTGDILLVSLGTGAAFRKCCTNFSFFKIVGQISAITLPKFPRFYYCFLLYDSLKKN